MNISDTRRFNPMYVIAIIAFAGMTVALVYSLWRHTDRLFLNRHLSQEIGDQGIPLNAEMATSSSSEKLQLIPHWHLFGKIPAEITAPPPRRVEAPKTRLNLKLKGVLSSDDPENARAIILAPGKQDKTYKIGETLPGGAEVADIRPDSALLKRNERFETLPLDKLPTDNQKSGGSGRSTSDLTPPGPKRVRRVRPSTQGKTQQ